MKIDPMEITWGDGRVRMERFTDKDGSFGLVLSEADGSHKPGETVDSPPVENHMPQPGEVYLRFKNMDGLKALIDSLVELMMGREDPAFHLTSKDYDDVFQRVRNGLEAVKASEERPIVEKTIDEAARIAEEHDCGNRAPDPCNCKYLIEKEILSLKARYK